MMKHLWLHTCDTLFRCYPGELYGISDVDAYAAAKEAIFARYRKVSEMLGLLLVRAAVRSKMNVMVETSGRDVAMYDYMDMAFPEVKHLWVRYWFQRTKWSSKYFIDIDEKYK